MRTLFVYPEFPKTFWSYEKILELVNRKVLLPPLGLVTVAALLPQEWEMKLVDRITANGIRVMAGFIIGLTARRMAQATASWTLSPAPVSPPR